MTTGYDIQRWNTCNMKAKENGLKIMVVGDAFDIMRLKPESYFGRLPTLDQLYSYLCGYEVGKASLKLK